MTNTAPSLRARLMVIILIPLTLVSMMAGYWRVTSAAATAREIFDLNLQALTLAISRDVVVSGGDVISDKTRQLLQGQFGANLFYHVYGPDGVFVTGYASPPVTPGEIEVKDNVPVLFRSVYRGEPVRVSRLREQANFEGVSGFASVTVWQSLAQREEFVERLASRAAIVILSLFLTVAVVIWFGIKLGLKPLSDLQDAIAQRSSGDLSEITRPVPPEIRGVVRTLNKLLGQVDAALSSRDRFISDAAHQLRNPVAGILSLAEAANDARSMGDQRVRVAELLDSARHASRLTEQLLSLDRAKGSSYRTRLRLVDLNQLVRSVCERNATDIIRRHIDLTFQEHPSALSVNADNVLLEEAVQNLIDNAVKHAGPENKEILIRTHATECSGIISVSDKGIGLSLSDSDIAFARFGQIQPGEGSGLGLAIVKEIMEFHGGVARIESSVTGARISLNLPLV